MSLVVSGDAGTAEGDFESCLMWSSRPGKELPVLIIVANNGYGISTEHDSQHAARVDRHPWRTAWHPLRHHQRQRCRGSTVERRGPGHAVRPHPTQAVHLEAMVSRLHGHSSSSGAQRNWEEADCVALFEQKLLDSGAIDSDTVRTLKDEAKQEADAAAVAVAGEPRPTRADVYRDTYAPSEHDAVYPEDYTGLPQRR